MTERSCDIAVLSHQVHQARVDEQFFTTYLPLFKHTDIHQLLEIGRGGLSFGHATVHQIVNAAIRAVRR